MAPQAESPRNSEVKRGDPVSSRPTGGPDTPRLSPIPVLYVNHVVEMSGAEGSLLTLLGALDRSQFRPLAALPATAGSLADRLAQLGVPLYEAPLQRLHRTANPLTNIVQVARLRRARASIGRICRVEKVALVHANSFHAALACAISGGPLPPIIWHVRDVQMPPPVVRWLAGRVARIVAISGAVAAHLAKLVPDSARKVVLVHNGIEAEGMRPTRPAAEVRAELGVPENAALVACVGQLVPWKRQELFIEAAHIVARFYPEAHFAIVGADLFGEHPEYVRQLQQAAAAGAAQITFHGYRPDATDIIAAADVLVHPATAEPLGRVILEAMALGTPVVAANAGGPAELLTDAESGLLVEPLAAQALADGILWLVENPAFAEDIARQARERVVANFSAASMARKIEAVYREVLGR